MAAQIVEKTEKVLVWKGRIESVAGAIAGVVLGALMVAAGVIRSGRDKQRREAPEKPLPESGVDALPAGVFFGVGALLIVVPPIWAYVTFKSRTAALLEGADLV